MKAVWITKHGGPGVLAVRETPDPAPAPGQVRVRVKASGLNFSELMARKGLYPDAPKPPCVVGYEGAGIVDAVGDGVRSVRAGDRVLFLSRFGGHSDTVITSEAQAFPMPKNMSFEEGAALPVTYLTAYHMLFRVSRVAPGDHVLIHMAAGGVGTALLQLCKTVGNITTYGTCSASKHEYARGQGLHHAIDYRTQDFVTEVQRLTNGRGVDFVYDAVGGSSFKRGYQVLRPGGQVVAFGVGSANKPGSRGLLTALAAVLALPVLTPMKLMNDNKGYSGVHMGHMWDQIELLRGQMEGILKLYEAGKIRPHIDRKVPFSAAREAFDLLDSGKSVGKVLLIPD